MMAGADIREDRVITDQAGNLQKQTVVRHTNQLSAEGPSTLKYLVQNERYLENLTKRLAGWVQVPDETNGKMVWKHTGKPIMNERGRAWLISQLGSALDKSVELSNYPPWRLQPILRSEFKSIAKHLATHLREYELRVIDCENVMLFMRRGIEAGYNRSINDRGARHVFGSLDENVNVSPQQQQGRKLFGVIPY